MRPRSRQFQHKHVIFFLINQKLVALNMQFAVIFPVVFQLVVAQQFWQFKIFCEHSDNIVKFIDFLPTTNGSLVFFFESCCPNSLVFICNIVHLFNSARVSSTLSYTFTLCKFLRILSPSFIARIVVRFGLSSPILNGISPSRRTVFVNIVKSPEIEIPIWSQKSDWLYDSPCFGKNNRKRFYNKTCFSAPDMLYSSHEVLENNSALAARALHFWMQLVSFFTRDHRTYTDLLERG